MLLFNLYNNVLINVIIYNNIFCLVSKLLRIKLILISKYITDFQHWYFLKFSINYVQYYLFFSETLFKIKPFLQSIPNRFEMQF